MARVFLSYSRKDKEFAFDLKNSLEQQGIDVWIDQEDIRAGLKWSTAIQHGLRDSDLMILLISPTSMESTNVEDEWQAYVDEGKSIIPVLCRPTPLKDIHFQLRRIQYIDFCNQPYDQALARLMAELRQSVIKAKPTPPNLLRGRH
jgi:hypothetical protein